MLNKLLNHYPSLFACKETIQQAADALIHCYADGKKVMACGNGGSCADADHIVGELMKGFCSDRKINDAIKQNIKNAL